MLGEYHKVVAGLVSDGARVIDIGCGEGELLAHLSAEKNAIVHGLEIDGKRVGKAVASGLAVVQGNADTDLQYYPDNGFDYAIMVLTMQVMKHPREVLEEALRIARKVIVVIPNFGHLRNRSYLAFKGRMPVTKKLSYEWYETPNIHFCTIRDFIVLTRKLGCNVEQSIYLHGQDKARKFNSHDNFTANLFGEYGVFVLKNI